MTRQEILAVAKPILFNTDMVRAILEGRKTVTRRAVKNGSRTPAGIGRDKFYTYVDALNGKPFNGAGFYKDSDIFCVDGVRYTDAEYFKTPFIPGDLLYVRETWQKQFGIYWYKATPTCGNATPPKKWRPSIHMPKEAARIFLRVTDVKAERLQEMRAQDAWNEGARCSCMSPVPDCAGNKDAFIRIWNSTTKPADLELYGWNANPWVWVYGFEKVEVTP